MTKTEILPPLGLAVLLLLGCARGANSPDFAPPEGRIANVKLYLSNQSDRRSVMLAVYVDGRLAAQQTLGQDIHEHREVPLCLPRGCHRIRVVAEGHVAEVTTEIVVGSGTTYVSASYWWSPGGRNERRVPEKVDIQVQDAPFGFC